MQKSLSPNMRVLFLVPYPTEGASNRFRVEQYLPYLKREDVDYKLNAFITPAFYKILYRKGYFLQKFFFFIYRTFVRVFCVFIALKYDVVFIHRESYPLGSPWIEKTLKFFNKKIIFDFDDAVFLPSSSGSNLMIERFNRYGKVPEVIALSDHVIAGNKYLAEFALRYNENVTIIPTVVNTDLYVPAKRKEHKKIVIGWIGSRTTSIFLEPLRDVFKEVLRRYSNVEIRIIGGEFDNRRLERVRNINWSLDREVGELQLFDIGIMPMPDTRWTRGKCAFKAILYMSMGIPCICSPVGMNRDIIKEGINGFLAASDKEWVGKLSLLIASRALREKIGLEARKEVIKKYSVSVNAPKVLEILRQVHE